MTNNDRTPAPADASGWRKILADAIDILDHYATYIHTVPADQLELHPYLPHIEDTAVELSLLSPTPPRPIDMGEIEHD